jgi:hypothetical protein
MAYDPYKVRLEELELKHDLLREQVIYNQDLQEKILTQLRKSNMYLSKLADYHLLDSEVEEEQEGDYS